MRLAEQPQRTLNSVANSALMKRKFTEGRGQRGEGEEGDPGGGRRMLCPSGLLKKDLQEEGSEVLTTSSQSSERAIRKRVPGDEPPGRSAELMEKEGKRPIFTSF